MLDCLSVPSEFCNAKGYLFIGLLALFDAALFAMDSYFLLKGLL